MRLRALAASRPNWGYRRLTLLQRRQGWAANHKLVYRLYKAEALGLRRRRPRRRVSAARREKVAVPSRCNQTWSMDFMADQLYSGRPVRILAIVDNYSRESLALQAGFRLTGEDVAGALDTLVRQRGIPTSIRCGPQVRRDNGTEFTSQAMDHWAYSHGVTLDFSRPGKPTDNGLIEAFNGRLRAECLNEHWFLTLGDVQDHLDAWREDYNGERPHSALQNMTPREFARLAVGAHPHGGGRSPDDRASTTRQPRPQACPTG
jgi:putative transposase